CGHLGCQSAGDRIRPLASLPLAEELLAASREIRPGTNLVRRTPVITTQDNLDHLDLPGRPTQSDPLGGLAVQASLPSTYLSSVSTGNPRSQPPHRLPGLGRARSTSCG